MALQSMFAKDWVFEVNTAVAGTATPTWTPVKGLTSVSLNFDSNTEDDSDFDSNGWGSSVVTQRSWSLDVEGMRKRTVGAVNFTPDAGQEFIRQAGFVVGFDATIHVRYYRKDGAPDAYEGFGSVDYNGGGGGVTDLEPFAFTVQGQGALTPIDNPSVG